MITSNFMGLTDICQGRDQLEIRAVVTRRRNYYLILTAISI
jgi:hypothetical protein